MNKIGVLLNAVKGRKIKVSITMNNGITYRCYVVNYLDTHRFLVSRKYEDNTLSDYSDNKKYNTIDIKYVGRVVIKASNNN